MIMRPKVPNQLVTQIHPDEHTRLMCVWGRSHDGRSLAAIANVIVDYGVGVLEAQATTERLRSVQACIAVGAGHSIRITMPNWTRCTDLALQFLPTRDTAGRMRRVTAHGVFRWALTIGLDALGIDLAEARREVASWCRATVRSSWPNVNGS